MTTDFPSLVIFDLDGVLVDTQAEENGALAYIGTLMGLKLDEQRQRELFSGKKMQDCLNLMEEMAQVAPPANAIALARVKCEELIGERLDPVDGVVDTLRRLSALDITMCVASNSPKKIIERRLAKADILHHFGNRLFSAYEISAWKPDPKLFLWAAAQCEASPRDCVVVEDSAVGVQAGLDAGMRVLHYTTAPETGLHRDGAKVFSAMDHITDLLLRRINVSPDSTAATN